jgi:hypothetical protein
MSSASASFRRVAVTVLLLFLPASTFADVFRHADLHLRAGNQPGSYELTARLPDSLRNAGALQWPAGCQQTEARQVDQAGRVMLVVRALCTQPLDRAAVIKAPWPLDGVRLSIGGEGLESGLMLRSSGGVVEIPFGVIQASPRRFLEIAPGMLWQGLLHIWLGWDHLAFVMCLCMLSRGWRLVGLVTAFTVGHSVSLGLAFFGVLRLPIAPVEALIALSIVWMAREALLARTAAPESGSQARGTMVVVAFGLLHGLGFASALDELGIERAERWASLLFFNIGVEVGQVLFVLAVTALFAALRPPRLQRALRQMTLYSAGIVGVFWLGERVASFS